MSNIERFLPDDNVLVQEKFKADKALKDRAETLAWKDTLEVNQFVRTSNAPELTPMILGSVAQVNPPSFELPDALDLHNFEDEAGANVGDTIDDARARSFGGDVGYLRPDGSYNDLKVAEDQFLLDFERAFYANRGNIPEDWLTEFSQDLKMLSDDPETTQRLYQSSVNASVFHQGQAILDEQAKARDAAVAKSYGSTADAATDANLQYDEWERTRGEDFTATIQTFADVTEYLGIDDAPRTGFLGGIQNVLDTNDLWQIAQRISEETGVDVKIVLFEKARDKWMSETDANIEGFGEIGANEWYENWYNPFAAVVEDKQSFADVREGIHNGLDDDIVQGAYAALGTFGQIFTAAGSGLGWVANEGVLAMGFSQGDITGGLDQFGRGFDKVFNNMEVVRQAEENQAGLREILGQDTETIAAGISAAPLLEQWNALPGVDREQHDMWMRMANSDEAMAFGMWSENLTYGTEYGAALDKQAEQIQAQALQTLTKMEDENFTMGDALLNFIAIWGEGVELAATGLTLGAKTIYQGMTGDHSHLENTQSFWSQTKSADTPAGVFGLEGTLVGLGLDLLIPGLVDPTTWVFAPRLAQSGRAGMITEQQIMQTVDSPSANIALDHGLKVVRSGEGSAVSASAMFDSLNQTYHGDKMISAMGGFGEVLTTLKPYLAKYGKVTDSVPIRVLDDIVGITDDVAMESLGLETLERIRATGVPEPVEVTINPRTGTARITANEDVYWAYKAGNFDGPPTTFVYDDMLGVVGADDLKVITEELGIVDGRISTIEAQRLTRYDQTATVREAAGSDSLLQSVTDEGVKESITIAYHPETNTAQVINGNNRVAAAALAG